MKTLRNILLITVSVFYGLITMVGIGLLGLLLYEGIDGFAGIVLFILFILLGLVLGYAVYKTASRQGFLRFSTAVYASPDLDNPEPAADSDFRKLDAAEYVEKYANGEKIFSGGYINIWGDFRARQLDIKNGISNVKLDGSGSLVLEFVNQNQLTVTEPQVILESASYLKILKAASIIWEWTDQGSGQRFYMNYLVSKRIIKTRTNSAWKSHNMDTSLGRPAVFIFNSD